MDKETLEAEQFAHPKVQTKCAAQERLCGRGHLLQPSSPPSPTRLSAALVSGAAWRRRSRPQGESLESAALVRGAVAWSRPQEEDRDSIYQVTCYRSSHLPRAYIKLRSPRWSYVEENAKKAWLGRRQGGSKTALHCQG